MKSYYHNGGCANVFDTSSVIRLYNLSVATKIDLKQHVDVHEMCKDGDDDSTPMYALSRMLVKA